MSKFFGCMLTVMIMMFASSCLSFKLLQNAAAEWWMVGSLWFFASVSLYFTLEEK